MKKTIDKAIRTIKFLTESGICQKNFAVARVSPASAGGWGAVVTFRKVTKVALWKVLTFPERYEKSAFRFTKSIKGMVFLLLFASAKSNQKQTEGCGPLDSRGAVQNSERWITC